MSHKDPHLSDSSRQITVTITDIAMPTDHGVAKADDFVLFVPGTIPGDRVTIRIVKREKSYGYGEVIAFETPTFIGMIEAIKNATSIKTLYR